MLAQFGVEQSVSLLAQAEPTLTAEKVGRIAIMLREKLYDGSPDLRQAYVRLILNEVSVDGREIRISGSKALLARAAAEGLGTSSPSVLSFVREWRVKADEDENWHVSLIL